MFLLVYSYLVKIFKNNSVILCHIFPSLLAILVSNTDFIIKLKITSSAGLKTFMLAIYEVTLHTLNGLLL